jgi:hypothetical protein
LTRRLTAVCLLCLAGLVSVVGGCADGQAATGPSLIDEAREAGLLKYLDEGATPTIESQEGDTTVYAFGPEDGPLCMRGDTYRFMVRETGSEKLLIFLQGGGACWSEFCLAVTAAPPGIPLVEALDPNNPSNPMADWNVLYLPYCDGSLFAGDADVDEDGDGVGDRLHRGLQNLSGSMRTIRDIFPDPKHVLLTGSSAGGFGTIPATLLVRATYPQAHLQVFNDSGVGIARPGEPDFIDGILDEQGITPMIPASCVDCSGDGHITRLVRWTLERDPNLEIAVFSSFQDSVMTGIFLTIEPEAFETALRTETGVLHELFPDRYRRFLVNGIEHTSLLGDPTGIIGEDIAALEFSEDAIAGLTNVNIGGLDRTDIDGFTVGQWLRAFVEGGDGWTDRLALEGQ